MQNLQAKDIQATFSLPLALSEDSGNEKRPIPGLAYVTDTDTGYTRRKSKSGFLFFDLAGKRLRAKDAVKRIQSLVIPPAWSDVWICPIAHGHLQATGRDARGRKQYIYHPQFRELRESDKYQHMLQFAQTLPVIRAQIRRDISRGGLPREKVIATVIWLLEATLIRVGNAEYAKENRSYGITTLRTPHVKLQGSEIRFQFRGKSGKAWKISLNDRRIAKIIRACQELPGQQLFQYEDATGALQTITSTDVNRYLQELTGKEITAKDFRTWAGTVMAAALLHEVDITQGDNRQRHIREAIKMVAERLGNTPTICRKCYIHPVILDLYTDDKLRLRIIQKTAARAALDPIERAVLALLKRQARGAATSR
jgi:DNA topoisomerase-1